MAKTRGFEIIKEYQKEEINLPVRQTQGAAGYDFESAETVAIPSIWQDTDKRPVLVKTGIKAFMQPDEYLQLANRSSNPLKNGLMMPNGVGIIDSDYYNNENNEGHIMFQFINIGPETVVIKKGDRIGQGIFMPFLKSDDDQSIGERLGGFGSSGK